MGISVFLPRVYAEIIHYKSIGETLNFHTPHLGFIAGALTNGMSQFVILYIPIVKASKFIKILQKVGAWGKGMIGSRWCHRFCGI
ncbi:hypothetical protein [Gilliamella sp. B2838]|uniref:hypothetical protein n=1 Tax=Gilliamella sp. B2838 TaxID=2818020 RepID=UPI00226A1C5F|nr:hypothetical protein [Gilliamella sp. B2838]MCX8728251.1 hypothetical protein [Gilliamella sp. B2838]